LTKAKEVKKLDKYYMNKYGITYAKYCEMAKNGCWLCEKKPKKGQRRFAVDHNHKTGKTRGILCYYCNFRRVGKLDTEWAYKIWEYLRSFEEAS